MSTDLHRALAALADGGERRTAPTADLLARVHRRRAARAAAAGAVGMGTVAAVAVGAVALAGRPDGPTPLPGSTQSLAGPSTAESTADTDPAPSGHAASCGSWAPDELVDEAPGVRLDLAPAAEVVEGEPVLVSGQVVPTGDADEIETNYLTVALLADGVVQALGTTIVNIADGGRMDLGAPVTAEVVLEPCGDDRLAPGEYTAVTTFGYGIVAGPGGELQTSSPVTVSAWPEDAASEAAREEALAAFLASPDGGDLFGTCGSQVPESLPTDPDLVLTAEVVPHPEQPRPRSYSAHASLENVSDEDLLVYESGFRTEFLLTRLDRVVGRGMPRAVLPAEDEPIALGAGNQAGLLVTGGFEMCPLPGTLPDTVDLPAGQYEMWTVATVNVATGEGSGVRQVTLVSDPLRITLD